VVLRRQAGGQRVAGNDRLAPDRALGGGIDVSRQALRSVRHAFEAGEARDIDDIGAAVALHHVHTEQIDAERRSAASRDVLQLGSERERLARVSSGVRAGRTRRTPKRSLPIE